MGEEGGVSEMLQAGGVVGHPVEDSGQEGHGVTVAVFALVEAGGSAEVGRGAVRRDRALLVAADGRRIVREGVDRPVADWVVLGQDDGLS